MDRTRKARAASLRFATLSDYTEQAKRYLILIEGGPPSNYSAWSPARVHRDG
jgi:hypothetical protein